MIAPFCENKALIHHLGGLLVVETRLCKNFGGNRPWFCGRGWTLEPKQQGRIWYH